MTTAEKKAIYAALAAPFPEHCIQRTEGRLTGRGFDTSGIGYQFIANRLNEVLGVGGWRAHRTVVVKGITRSNGRPAFEAICDITLELGEWIDGNFIVFAESLADGGHVASSEADARKGSYTNAFKKAAAFHGVGRQAYEGSLDDDNLPGEHVVQTVQQPVQRAVPAQVPVQPIQPTQNTQLAQPATRPASTQPRNRLTSKQLGALQAISRKLGMDHGGLRAISKTRFNAQPEFLTREQASQMIATMSAQLNGNGHDREESNADEPGMAG
jgi:hypothetical protein